MASSAPHPLFPPREGKAAADVDTIHITRLEGKTFTYAPVSYPADELQEPGDIFERFGGGLYELIARSNATKKITQKERLALPGEPKPLDGSTPALPAAPAGPAALAPPAGSSDAIMLGVMQMMQVQSQNMMTMVTALLSTGQSHAESHVERMQQASRAATEQMGQLFTAMLSARSGGGESTLEGALKFVEMGVELAQGAKEGGGGEDDSTMGAFTQALEQGAKVIDKFRDMQAAGQPLPATAPPGWPTGAPWPPPPRRPAPTPAAPRPAGDNGQPSAPAGPPASSSDAAPPFVGPIAE